MGPKIKGGGKPAPEPAEVTPADTEQAAKTARSDIAGRAGRQKLKNVRDSISSFINI